MVKDEVFLLDIRDQNRNELSLAPGHTPSGDRVLYLFAGQDAEAQDAEAWCTGMFDMSPSNARLLVDALRNWLGDE
ncbi:MAG: hypothetical protein AB7Q01_08445 [Gammaproteobacteria bacterium]